MSWPRLLHNPACTKSRQALALVHTRFPFVSVHDFVKTPLSRDFMAAMLRSYAPPHALVRGLSAEEKLKHSQTDLLDILVKEPKRLERPLLLFEDGRVVIGRPLEVVEKALREFSDDE